MTKVITTIEEHPDKRYGINGTENGAEFEIKAKAFAMGEIIGETQSEANMAREQLTQRTGTKKSFISRRVNGNSNIQLSTLYRMMELGLDKQVNLSIG